MLCGRFEASYLSMVGTGVIPASQLVFSAELAETLGLEEAILVQQLRSLYQHLPATTVDGE